ncbi:MAG TPA: hypothetical protein HA300_02205 [Thermococcaceae archaeon]|nr:hypothetical protein [Thermococcaceae archaeon]
MSIVGLLVFSSFGFVFAQESFREVKNSQVPVSSEACSACSSCRDFDVDKALGEVNLKIENLTKLINQKEAELQGLYAELNKTKSVETLEKIVKLEDEAQLLKSDLEFYKRQELSLELIKKYTRRTPYGVEVLYYRLPREDELVREYIEKVHSVRKDVDLKWFIAFYRQAGELTFDEYVVTDMKLREVIKEIKAGNATVEDALKLIRQRKEIWDRIYAYLEERDKLQTFKNLKELGRKQTIMKTMGIEPYGIYSNVTYYNELGVKYSCAEIIIDGIPYCGANPLKQTLPSYTYPGTPSFKDLTPIAVWVGVYSSSEPNTDYYLGEFCTYTFKKESKLHEYWELAKYYDSRAKSVQIKYFYDGIAYNPSTGEYQIANLIWQFECNSATNCWVTSYRPRLPDPNDPLTIPNGEYVIRVFSRALRSNCCRSSSSHDNPYGCHWSNGHCNACFAPDDSASQNFPHEDRPTREYIPQESN